MSPLAKLLRWLGIELDTDDLNTRDDLERLYKTAAALGARASKQQRPPPPPAWG